MGNTLRRLFRRKQLGEETNREELRKLGLVLTGAGVVAVVLNHNGYGVISVTIGVLFYYFGLTAPTEEFNG